MAERSARQSAASEAQFQQYVRTTAGKTGSSADELAKLATLKADGTISDAEFAQAKAKILA